MCHCGAENLIYFLSQMPRSFSDRVRVVYLVNLRSVPAQQTSAEIRLYFSTWILARVSLCINTALHIFTAPERDLIFFSRFNKICFLAVSRSIMHWEKDMHYSKVFIFYVLQCDKFC